MEEIFYRRIPVSAEKEGNGFTLVLLHGFLEDKSIWNPFVEALKKDFTIVTIDLLGHGKTPKMGYIHTMEEMAKQVKTVLDHFNIEKASFVGHSMGGYVTLAFEELFPNKIEHLVLLNSTSIADSEERKENRDRAKKLVKQNKSAFISMSIKHLFAEEKREELREEINNLIEKAKKLDSSAIIASIEGLKTRKDRTELLKNFSRKKTIICGKQDTIISFQEISAIAKETNCELISFPDGHMTYLENKEALLKTLQQIL